MQTSKVHFVIEWEVYEELVPKQNFVEAGRRRKKLRLENESHQECLAEGSDRSRSLPVRTVEHVDDEECDESASST